MKRRINAPLFQPFNRCALFKPPPLSSPATRGRIKERGLNDLNGLNQFLINNQRIVAVRNWRHSALDPVLFALLHKYPVNFRILILILDECPAFA
jgi:hypothetical protein